MRLAIGFGCFLLLIGASVSEAQQPSTPDQSEPAGTKSSLPDAPSPVVPRSTHADHRFFDLYGKIANGANLGAATLDDVGTCRTLASGGHEDYLPTQHCGPASALIFGGLAFDISISYVLHRTGHHKLERIVEIAGVADSVTGIAYTVAHGGKW